MFDFKTPAFETFQVENVRHAVSQTISKYGLRDIDLQMQEDLWNRTLIASLMVSLASNQVTTTIESSQEVPVGVRSAIVWDLELRLKSLHSTLGRHPWLKWFHRPLAWMLDKAVAARSRCRTKTIETVAKHYHVCPHAAFGATEHHRQWVTIQMPKRSERAELLRRQTIERIVAKALIVADTSMGSALAEHFGRLGLPSDSPDLDSFGQLLHLARELAAIQRIE